MQESQDGILELSDHATSTVARMIQWLYLGDFDTPARDVSRIRDFPTIEEMVGESAPDGEWKGTKIRETEAQLVKIYLDVSRLAAQYVMANLHMQVAWQIATILSRLQGNQKEDIAFLAQNYIECHKAIAKCIEEDASLKKKMADVVVRFKLAGQLPDPFVSRLDAEIMKNDIEFVMMISWSLEREARSNLQKLGKHEREKEASITQAKKRRTPAVKASK